MEGNTAEGFVRLIAVNGALGLCQPTTESPAPSAHFHLGAAATYSPVDRAERSPDWELGSLEGSREIRDLIPSGRSGTGSQENTGQQEHHC